MLRGLTQRLDNYLIAKTLASFPHRLNQQRIYILPTRAGYLYATVLLVMLMGAINYTNSLAFVLTFLLGGMGLVGMLHTFRNLHGLEILSGRAEAAFAGEPAQFSLAVRNHIDQERIGLRLERRSPLLSIWRQFFDRLRASQGTSFDVPARHAVNVALPIATERRGRLPLGRVKLWTQFPLGLFHAWSVFDPGLEALVYPKPAGSREFPISGGEYGAASTGDQPGTDDFVGFRKYQPGDSPRYIYWRAVARGQEPVVKVFHGAGAATLRLDWAHTAHLGETEARLSQLCLWVVEAERQGLRYGLNLPGETIAPGGGAVHCARCLRALALFGEAGEQTR
jgi:uncharacterized protein (DUF58 family)